MAHLLNGDRLPVWDVIEKVLTALDVEAEPLRPTYEAAAKTTPPGTPSNYERALDAYRSAARSKALTLRMPSIFGIDSVADMATVFIEPSVRVRKST